MTWSNSRAGFYQADEGCLRGHDHTPALRLDDRRIAEELDGVPQTLIGVEEDGFPLERLAHPELLRSPWGIAVAMPHLLLELCPPSLEVAEGEPGYRPVTAGLLVVRLQSEGLAERGDRLGEPLQLDERDPSVVMGLSLLRVHANRPIVTGDRLDATSQLVQEEASVAVHLRVIRRKSQRAIGVDQRRFELAKRGTPWPTSYAPRVGPGPIRRRAGGWAARLPIDQDPIRPSRGQVVPRANRGTV